MTVTTPRGFRAAGVTAGLKVSGRPDLALVVNDGPLQSAAAVFTSNRFPAAPVLWTRQTVADGELHAVVLNSGGANACTGPEGFADTHRTAEHVAGVLSSLGAATGAGEIGVCSTGLIGERLPMDLLLAGVDAAASALSEDGGQDAAVAIMTAAPAETSSSTQRPPALMSTTKIPNPTIETARCTTTGAIRCPISVTVASPRSAR